MIKNCPACLGQGPGLKGRKMILFDAQGKSPEYYPEAPIDWGRWPFKGPSPPNTWASPSAQTVSSHWPTGAEYFTPVRV